MVRIVLKGVHKTTKKLADGSRRHYYYAWKGGPRLDGEPGSAEFVASYAKATQSRTEGLEGTFGALVHKYRAGPLQGKRKSTRIDYERSLKEIHDKFHDMPLPKVESDYLLARRVFNDWRNGLDLSPRAADKRWTMLSAVCTFGVQIGELVRNPCQFGGNTWRGSRKEKIWEQWQIDLVIAHVSSELSLPMRIALETGQRLGDVLSLTWSQFDGERIRLAQSKRGARVSVLLSRALAMHLRSLERKAVTICTNTRGRPWTVSGYSKLFARKKAALGIDDLTFHDLRGTAVVMARRNGAQKYEIASRFGWTIRSVDRILETHYLADDQQLSDAITLRAEAKSGTTLQTVSKPDGGE